MPNSSAMEQAPPPPSKPNGASPKLYMTPQLAKRRDGLAPSLLNLAKRPATVTGGLNKPYRTTSKLLLQSPDPASQMQTIVEAVKTVIQKASSSKSSEFSGSQFTPQGIIWKMSMSNKDAASNYSLKVSIAANEKDDIVHYLVDTVLAPRKATSSSSSQPKGFAEGKVAFENLSLVVRKAVVGLEFPEFPEGCKGRSFREVYQLNARVRKL